MTPRVTTRSAIHDKGSIVSQQLFSLCLLLLLMTSTTVVAAPLLQEQRAFLRRQNGEEQEPITPASFVSSRSSISGTTTKSLVSPNHRVLQEGNENEGADKKNKNDNPNQTVAEGQDWVWTLTNVIGSTSESDDVKVAMAGNEYLVIGERRLGDGLVQTQYRPELHHENSKNKKKQNQNDTVSTPLAFQSMYDIKFLEGTRNFGDSVDAVLVPTITTNDMKNNTNKNTTNTTTTTYYPAMLIGASRTFHETVPGLVTGSAHYLVYDGSTWNEIGGAIRSDERVPDTVGLFGAAVAMNTPTSSVSSLSSYRRVAVGAPSSGLFKAGKVYTFQYNHTTVMWEKMSSALTGDGANNRFGTSIDINADGTRLLVGAPGHKDGAGEVLYYEWNETRREWDHVFSVSGAKTQGMGSSVQFIHEDGSAFIVGAPVYASGMVQVYIQQQSSASAVFGEDANQTEVILEHNKEHNTTSTVQKHPSATQFLQWGNTITGTASGEQVGSTVCGNNAGRIAFGTALGSFHVYDYNPKSQQWEPVANSPVSTPGLHGGVISIALSEHSQTVTVGLEKNQQVLVYDLLSPNSDFLTSSSSAPPHEQNTVANTEDENDDEDSNTTTATDPSNQDPPPEELSEEDGGDQDGNPSPTSAPSCTPQPSVTAAPTAAHKVRPSAPTIVTPDLFTEDFTRGGSFVVLIVLLGLAVIIFICLACGWC